MHPLKEIVNQNKNGIPIGVCSVCSSNGLVIEAAMEQAAEFGSLLLIEATANQVNQFGGYTGMRPLDFRSYVSNIAQKVKFPPEKIILGGDHLGPLIWRGENAKAAMEKAESLVKEFVKAGFTKIHLDTSMKLGGDVERPLSPEVIAERGATLCEIAEKAFEESSINEERPVYVIGSEVPIPGGAQDDEGLRVTRTEDFQETVELFRKSFLKRGLEKAWENVVAVVVQPGVEFGSHTVHDYDHAKAVELIHTIDQYPHIVFEGHSTDYQKQQSLRQLVADHVAILKVGPALTYALREGLCALEQIERDLLPDEKNRSEFGSILEKAMMANPADWENHYQGSEAQNRLDRKYSYSDRCRYYFNDGSVENAVHLLFGNLSRSEIPMSMISQYFPSLYWKIRDGRMSSSPIELAKGRIKDTLDIYYSSVMP